MGVPSTRHKQACGLVSTQLCGCSAPTKTLVNRNDLLRRLQDYLAEIEGYGRHSPVWPLSDGRLSDIFQRLSNGLVDCNGNIATYNPVLAYLTGSHNNCQIMGGQDQALAAVFYICPYIAKRKAPLEESMSLLNHCFELAQQYPTSVEEERGSPERLVKHVLQKTLNK